MISRWPVLEHHQVTAHDVANGVVTEAALAAWAMQAREAYVAQNHALHGALGHGLHLDIELRHLDVARRRIGAPTRVAVSAGVGEVHPDSFTLNTRVRALDTDDEVAVTVPAVIRLVADDGAVAPITKELRDAMTALEREARHHN